MEESFSSNLTNPNENLTRKSSDLAGIYLTNIFSNDKQNGLTTTTKLLPESDIQIVQTTKGKFKGRSKGPGPLYPEYLEVFGIQTSEKDGYIAHCFLCNKDLANNGFVRLHIISKKHKDAERYYRATHPVKEEVSEETSKVTLQTVDTTLSAQPSSVIGLVKEEPRDEVDDAQEKVDEASLKIRHRGIFLDLKSRPKESRPTFDYAQIFAGMPKDVLDLILRVGNVNGGEINRIDEEQIKDEENSSLEIFRLNLDFPSTSTSQIATIDEDEPMDIKPSEMTELTSTEDTHPEEQFDVIQKSHKGDHYFYCKVCKRHLTKMRSNPTQRHLNSMNHKKNFQAIAKSLAGPIAGKPTTNAKPFLSEYCEQFDGIQPSSRGSEYYYCTYCKRDIVFTDVSCLEKHVKILDHLVNMAKENVANTVEIDTPTGDPFQRPPPKNYSKNKPEVEKRPKTAFILYLMEERPKLIEANPGIHQMDVFRKLGQMWKQLPEATKLKYFREEKRIRRLKKADKVIYRRDRTSKCSFQLAKVPRNLRSKMGAIYPQRSLSSTRRWAALKSQALTKFVRKSGRHVEKSEVQKEAENGQDNKEAMQEHETSMEDIVKLEPVENEETNVFEFTPNGTPETPTTSQNSNTTPIKTEPLDISEETLTVRPKPVESYRSPSSCEKPKTSNFSFNELLQSKNRNLVNPMNQITELLKSNLQTSNANKRASPQYIKKINEKTPLVQPSMPNSDFVYVPRRRIPIVPPIIKRIDYGHPRHPSILQPSTSVDGMEVLPAKKTRLSRD
uniref:HMG box domain-containing protein n=1 Tax=Acrobeloides nanus TaxID=290746 RepID=A0A914BWE1_9BILA